MKVLILLAVIAGSQAFLFAKDDPAKPASHQVEERCLQLAEEGNCEFYDCLEKRHVCHGFAMRRAKPSCMAFNAKRNRFNGDGKDWIMAARKCLMKELKTQYLSDSMSCRSLNKFGHDTYRRCVTEVEPSICGIFWENKSAIKESIDFSDFRTMRTLGRIVMHCGRDTGKMFMKYVTDALNIKTPSWISKK